jgi:hypothetical protein
MGSDPSAQGSRLGGCASACLRRSATRAGSSRTSASTSMPAASIVLRSTVQQLAAVQRRRGQVCVHVAAHAAQRSTEVRRACSSPTQPPPAPPESRGLVAHDARRPHRAPLWSSAAAHAATHTAAADALGLGPAGWWAGPAAPAAGIGSWVEDGRAGGVGAECGLPSPGTDPPRCRVPPLDARHHPVPGQRCPSRRQPNLGRADAVRSRHVGLIGRKGCPRHPWLPYPSSRWSSDGPFGAGFGRSSGAGV